MRTERYVTTKIFLRLASPIGTLVVAEDGVGICDLFLCEGDAPAGMHEGMTSLLRDAARQLTEYFAGERKTFSLPLSLHGTTFQKSDWNALCTIPYGETRSYRQIAEQIGSPKAVRAVGQANGRNPVMIVIPCHRVIAADGSIGGYAGSLDVKRFLLHLEQEYSA
jgi:methylated-DNA-[protein]-cysteine S-methyltransferase